MADLSTETELAYWYEREGAPRGMFAAADGLWSVADSTGTPAGVVRFLTAGFQSNVTYWLNDLSGQPVIGLAEPQGIGEAMEDSSLRLLGPDGAQRGAIRGTDVWWDQAPVGKLSAQSVERPLGLEGAWMWTWSDDLVATVTQTPVPNVGVYLQLHRSAGLAEPLASLTLLVPLVAHHAVLQQARANAARSRRRRKRRH